MKILVILPNWLGDAIMATPAIELLASHYRDARFTFVGSYVSIEALKHHPLCERAIVDDTKKASNRYIATYRLAGELGQFNLAVNFRNQLHASLLLRFTKTVVCISRRSWHSMFLLSHTPKISTTQHLVKQYAQLAMTDADHWNAQVPKLALYIEPKRYDKLTLGINAGATYGSAKRWYPERFAEVAKEFSNQYDIVIFGGPNEVEMASEIESNLKYFNITNYKNLAGKTKIEELCANIAGCSLFITNDSGPMHVAASYQVPTVAIFGPTKHKETSQWMNEKSAIVRHEMDCSPCMKRECPLGHHDCMKTITAAEVIETVKSII
ncbi:ADP-heptose--lipooligosaccharide heptosyltransferase II [Sulfurimonas gotlandica GD1]|uniref:lipopolysaccharide heptosyltransferase II n=1 Tax=Sulfurimonas gotlandica (strain DSM 19862 / JCM 16533 / GD1) TaxID=929558 RepID=H1FWH3_SULGG|nr:lipopolysaccharide heptosyltransferase II [Sulfurimonas gotlandica]EHP30476.1 ADP-heptose--lipooligosaccharide heptosyltransferase II [Sulfurimonas gotlandica GD1]